MENITAYKPVNEVETDVFMGTFTLDYNYICFIIDTGV